MNSEPDDAGLWPGVSKNKNGPAVDCGDMSPL